MSTTIHDLLDLEETTGGRYRCLLPDCGGSGLHVTPEAGDTGSVTCHSCGFGKRHDRKHKGTGAAYLAAVRDITIREALERFGVATANGQSELQERARKREAPPMPERPELTDAEAAERFRAYMLMTPTEVVLEKKYRDRRFQARLDRKPREVRRWDRKIATLCDQVMRREKAQQYDIDKMDSNYERD